MVVHCLFEQSGTFKNEFRRLNYEAYDYDILNDFGETDKCIDLFHEIEAAYIGGGVNFRRHKARGSNYSFLSLCTL